MEVTEAFTRFSPTQAYQILDLSEMALKAATLEDFVATALPGIAALMRAPAAMLYVSDPRLAAPAFFFHGIPLQASLSVERWCAGQIEQFSQHADLRQTRLPPSPEWETIPEMVSYPLRAEAGCLGLLGLARGAGLSPFPADLLEKLLQLVSAAASQLAERAKLGRQLAHLNAYLTVSSMLAQSQGLHEQLEVALYCCMELVIAETASVLLLDDEKRNFRFYHVEGPAKPLLEAAVFPADRGLAGAVLNNQQSEVINDVLNDPRFYGQIDTQSGFQTRNMIAIPLIAGDEKIGVLEVLNKADGTDFTEEERLLLVSIAEEIAFAIRDAKVFEYVANSYCKQRQGLASCKGCQRPLGAWTPCVKYREAVI